MDNSITTSLATFNEMQVKIRIKLSKSDDSVLADIKDNEAMAVAMDWKQPKGESLVNYALYYSLIEKNENQSLEYAERAKEFIDLTNPKGAAYFYGNIALCYQTFTRLQEAQEYYLKAVQTLEAQDELTEAEKKRLSSFYYNLHILFDVYEFNDPTNGYIDKALELNLATNNKVGISYCYVALSTIYFKKGMYKEALNVALKRVKIATELDSYLDMCSAHSSIASVYAYVGMKEEALFHIEQSKKFFNPDLTNFQFSFYANLGEAYIGLNDYRNAIVQLTNAENVHTKGIKNVFISVTYKNFSIAYEALGDIPRALEYQKKYSQQIIDSVKLNKDLTVAAAQNELRYRQQLKETQLLKEKNDEINTYVKKLLISNDELKTFAHAASHDLREPVRMIVSFTELLEKSFKTPLNKEQQEFIGYVKDGGKRMNELILGILELAKINQDVVMTDVDLNETMHIVQNNLHVPIEKSNAVIQCDPLPTIYTSSPLMTQLFQNIVANGIKYNQSAKPTIIIKCRTDNEWHHISISDNGIGIDDKFKEKVFEMFTRLHNREEYTGSGIGLALCRKIVNRMGGEIWAQPNSSGGTDFLFTLPIVNTLL